MNNPTVISHTQPADDQSPAGHFLITGKTVLAMILMKDLLNQNADGEHHD